MVKIIPDTPDVEILASCHHEPANRKDLIVIVIEDVKRCHCSMLAEFINMLSEWVVQIQFVLVMGMEITVHSLRKLRRVGKIGEFMSVFVNVKQHCVYVASDGGHVF